MLEGAPNLSHDASDVPLRTDSFLWKHRLPATSFDDGKNANKLIRSQYLGSLYFKKTK